jgi:hypothetical protein
VKWWKKLFLSFFDVAIVNKHVLCNKVSSKNIQLQKFCGKVAKGLACDVRKEIIEQARATFVGRLVGKNHCAYRYWHESESLSLNSQLWVGR